MVIKNHVGGQGMAMMSMMEEQKKGGGSGSSGSSGAAPTPGGSSNLTSTPDVDDAFAKSELVLVQAITLDGITDNSKYIYSC